MNVYLKRERILGRFVMRPKCDFSKFLCELMTRKSVSETMIKVLEKNGYVVVREE